MSSARSRQRLLGVLASLFVTGCASTTEPEMCGSRKTPQKSLDLQHLTHFQMLDEETATAAWGITAGSVCTHEHANVEYELSLHSLAGFEVEGVVVYGGNRIRELPQEFQSEGGLWVYSGKDNFGVRDVFGDGPGDWTFIVVVAFPHQGSAQADSLFLSSNIESGQMSAEYWEHKY